FHQKFCVKKNHEYLCKIGRLKLYKSEIQPACCIISCLAEKKNSGKHNDIQSIERPVKTENPFIIDQRYNDHRNRAKKNSHDLTAHQIRSGTSYHKNSEDGNCQHKNDKAETIIS